MTPTEKLALLYRTLDWLEAHPDRAIMNNEATTHYGSTCDPLSNLAHCFCFIGRLQKETGVASTTSYFSDWLDEIGTYPSAFITINDQHAIPAERFAELRTYINDIGKGLAA